MRRKDFSERSKRERAAWFDAYGSLYGDSVPEKQNPSPVAPRSRKKRIGRSEGDEQRVVVVWLEKNEIPFFAVPNGGSRNLLEAVNLKRQGVKSGVPDLVLPIQRLPFGSLYIELKRKDGKHTVSDSQKEWINTLRQNGQRAEICVGADQAIELIKSYLHL